MTVPRAECSSALTLFRVRLAPPREPDGTQNQIFWTSNSGELAYSIEFCRLSKEKGTVGEKWEWRIDWENCVPPIIYTVLTPWPFVNFTCTAPDGRSDKSVFRFIRKIAEEESVTVYGGGAQERDFPYADDIAHGTVAALALPCCETVNLRDGSPVALNDIIGPIKGWAGKRASIGFQERHSADPAMTWADIGRAPDLLA